MVFLGTGKSVPKLQSTSTPVAKTATGSTMIQPGTAAALAAKARKKGKLQEFVLTVDIDTRQASRPEARAL
jgi:hypothetical protein